MKTITITLSVPDDVTVAVERAQPVAASVAPPSDAATTLNQWLPGACPKHGVERWGPSKYGGFYCSAKDEQGPKGYCILKSGMEFNGRVIP